MLGHISHHEWLADGLSTGDAERAVAVGIGAIGRLHENVARNLFHGAKHRLIADPAPPQGELKHHLFRRILGRGHVNLVRALVGAVYRASAEQVEPICAAGLKENFPSNRRSYHGTRLLPCR